jgi:EAL domain-containing protein (putative c-di-GMP-specific phosphodiesterase class I)
VLGAQLRNAVADDQLLVYYQPKARMSDGAIIGAEALVRWRHPDHGLMPPDEFVPVAERTGSIGALTSLVLRTALEQRAAWSRRGHDLGIAVNISVASLLDIDLPAQVARLLQVTRTPPASLTLEVTESGIMDPRRGVAALEQLAATGVRISIDDFGTGYSSLAYLARLPVHELKVDRSFVLAMAAEESSATIVRTIVDLGESLGLAVVAEGIEDRITWDALRSTGCHVGQGYFLSRPVPAAVLERWLDGLTRDLVTGSPTLR